MLVLATADAVHDVLRGSRNYVHLKWHRATAAFRFRISRGPRRGGPAVLSEIGRQRERERERERDGREQTREVL
jgi:hypothetical protein